ncbi:hypothetical protein [Vibrio ziniensis]|uniref:Outer membrane protein beta-barrel domain-containing protein n=1 Tax=Vibrio ziniensis TaxID=2711221 RepID=A0A6G7CJI0_9VIBR|nr:hypothetical protein [Vibrio ziniensis]QIH42277.1 hypothetical protein G5S32_09820 [Vibrio ziniensis]
MNKIGVVVILCATSVSSYAAQNKGFEVGMAIDQQLSVVFEIDDQYRFILGNGGIAFDYIFANGSFGSNVPFDWYVGGGAWTDWDADDLGVRLPLGLDWQINDKFDVYGQIHPEVNFDDGAELQIGAALGLTYHF